ncbi:hypothetical protein LCGC14_0358990 [marine sediment metagenome]|uniref:Uncharacterized protein n=1 Tax=marine sediment metagenome TaxID=412755 RepID=A0A0F9TEH1_9ZZZZ
MNLNDTWKNCLKMWKWIAEQSSTRGAIGLKHEWMKANNCDSLINDCHFCQYHNEQGGENSEQGFCLSCPGVLVDPTFDCMSGIYGYGTPIKFNEKIIALNKQRLEESDNG